MALPGVKVWKCKIIVPAESVLPDGFDYPPRHAAIDAIEKEGVEVLDCFSGWGGKLDEVEESVMRSRKAKENL